MSRWLDQIKSLMSEEQPEPERVELAAAVLLLETVIADHDEDEDELEVVERAIGETFEIPRAAVDELLQEAREAHRHAVDMQRFTSSIRANWQPRHRGDLLEAMWRVAYADGRLDRYEEAHLRKAADLLGLRHAEFIQRKHRVTGE